MPQALESTPAQAPFYAVLNERVERHFQRTNQQERNQLSMYFKTAVILAWAVGSYLALLLWVTNGWQAALASISLGLAMAGIGFNIQHDGNHGAYSDRAWVNTLMALSLDVLGGSSYIWRWKHNVFHHSHPNTVGEDSDIDLEPFSRLAPTQKRRSGHRFQFIYIWFLYGLLAPKWQFFDDFRNLRSAHIGLRKFPLPRGAQKALLWTGKLLFVGWAFVLPMWLHPVGAVLACYALAASVLGFSLAVTFQLAHCVGEADFRGAGEELGNRDEWAKRQVLSTVDFAPGNALLTWYLGGLNYQIEHHLFPRICHVHYPELSKIVQASCEEYGVRYTVQPSAFKALGAHARWVWKMGLAPA